ncbi:hypothetical protein UMM65_07185 [Aureibaculum sp. 2210JD6-5]|uniref:hypothetical protein n=1 Tax=Aureibaculum sp. 2210JD6-5 TaxID=3103957 RepID=UPI002AAE9AD4|nr:hypothetical protein [Aureibaculum sp. 2210JD6-5]MDY7395019.1 hypothetical protein [Aureibaculum sp. 2210JD6-5]
MELEEMKSLWTNLSKEVEQQKILTDNLIMEMTKERFNSKLSKIAIPETIGAIMCIAFALFILINFNKLDTWYFITCGIFTVLYLILLPILSMQSLYKMKNISLDNKDYKETLMIYSRNKNRYMLIQKSSIYFSLLLIFTSMPLAGKIFNNKDIFLNSTIWYIYLPIMILFLFLFSRWAIKCVGNITQSGEELLNDLEKNSK